MPFRFGILTDEVSQDLDIVIGLCHEYGLQAVELRSVDNELLYKLPDRRIREIGEQIRNAGLSICGLSSPVFKCELDDPAELAEHVSILKRYLDIAGQLNVPYIRGFSFWAKHSFESAMPGIVKQIQSIIPLLQSSRVTFALEFDPAVYATNAKKTAKLIDAIASPWVRGLYDPGNAIWDPDGEMPFPYGYQHLKGRICHIHLKDAIQTVDGIKGVAIGTGAVDYRGLFKQLQQDRYDGYMVVETHYRLVGELTEEQLKRPAGQSFSEGGETATRECLDSLFALIKELFPETSERSDHR